MFTVIASHIKAIALAGTVACGGAFGAHAAYTHPHQDRTPVRYEQRSNDHRPVRTDRLDHYGNRTPDFHADRSHR